MRATVAQLPEFISFGEKQLMATVLNNFFRVVLYFY